MRAPFFISLPGSRTVYRGESVTLSGLANGSGPLGYQWRKNGTPLSGATNATYTLSSVQAADVANYDLVVTNSAGTAVSPATSVFMLEGVAPTLLSQPVSGLINVGNVVRLSVSATGTPAPYYQWRKNGVNLAGSTGSVLGFVSTSTQDAGVYDVVVSNGGGSVVSLPATVSFGQLPVGEHPTSRFVRLGEPVEFSILPFTAPGTTYQWLKDGSPLSQTVPLYNLEGQPAGEVASGQPVPTGRWTTAKGGAQWLLGLGREHAGVVAGTSLPLNAVTISDLGSYGVGVTANSTTSLRGPATLALRGTGTLGRRHIAAGGDTLLTSDDGVTWTPRLIGGGFGIQGVAALGSVAVAVGDDGRILRSTDAINWTIVPNGNVSTLSAVVAGPDRFVAVGNTGRVVVSPNGLDWYLADSRTSSALTAVTYGKGVYVYGGTNGTIFVSYDGFRWLNRNSQTTSGIRFLTYDGQRFWAATNSNQLLTSPDGLEWTLTPTALPTWFRSLSYDGTSLVAVGDSGRIHTSPDGVNWTPRAVGVTPANLRAVTWSGPELPSSYSPASFLSDLDFRVVQEPQAISAVLGQPASFSVAVSGGTASYQWIKDGTPLSGATQTTLPFTAVQADHVGEYQVVVTSSAGMIFSSKARLAIVGNGALGAQFLAVGAGGTIAASSNGLMFTERSSSTDRVWRAVAASAYRAVAVGHANAVAVSSDGAIWTSRTLSLPGAPRILRGVAAGLTQFVAVGSAGTIVTSFDQGETWTLQSSGTTQSLYGVAWDRSRFVAVGEGGVVLSSIDGIVWSPAASPTSERLYTIAANGTKLIAVTNSGGAFETANGGGSWQAAGSSAAFWARSAVMSPNGRRVVVGDRGSIATSSNGTSWSFASSPTSDRLYGVAWTGTPATLFGTVTDAIDGPALRIVTQPVATSLAAGGTAVLSVTAAGASPIGYQWQRDGVDVANGTNATLLLPNIQLTQAGQYAVVVTNPTATLVSASATLTVLPATAGSPPVILTAPEGRTVNVGGSVNFSVTASGTAPLSYRWLFNGQTIPGAAASTLPLTGVQLANAGGYSVTVSNAHGSVTSNPAALTVTTVPGLPTFTQQPVGQAIAAGGVAMFTATATGAGTISYQWRKDGVALPNETGTSLRIEAITLAAAGVYSVSATNNVGTVISESAGLTVVPVGTAATHSQVDGAGYTAGGTVSIRSTLSYVGDASSLGWEVLLPAGWTFASASGAAGDIQPMSGEMSLLSWAWTAPPASPVTFTYVLNVPADATGPQQVAALAILRQGGVPIRLMAQRDPLVIAPIAALHSADSNGDTRLDLSELTRVIELFNTRNGSSRTGAYRVDAAGEDGFAADATRAAGTSATLASYHSADTRGATDGSPRDGAVGLFELTRVIELYNYRAGNVRTGEYHTQAGSEDGFAAGP